jgi:hypothetical protein
VGLAALPGWSGVAQVIGLFIGLELMTNMVLEPVLYAGAAGVSQVALLIAIAFWTWLWGPLGLLLATPMTVCLVVLGTHVPGLEFLATVLADAPALTPDVRYYQRLLARDQSEAADMLEAYVKREPPATVYDALLLPALNYAERDRFDDQLSDDEERAVIEATRELVDDLTVRPSEPSAASVATRGDGSQPIHVFGCAANSESDALALRMLNELVREGGMVVDVPSVRLVASELIDAVRAGGYRVICIADLPPSAPSKTRYLIKRLRASLPELKITVGRWAPPSLADETLQPLREAGADHASATLIQTRDVLLQLAAALPPAGAKAPRAMEAPPRRLHPA